MAPSTHPDLPPQKRKSPVTQMKFNKPITLINRAEAPSQPHAPAQRERSKDPYEQLG